MRKYRLISLAAFVVLTACNSAKKPDAANFKTAINHYLASHGQVCISVDGRFPIDVPAARQSDQHGVGVPLADLANAGLVNATNTTAVVQTLANSLSLSPRKPEPVKRYTVSAEGQKYLHSVMTDFGKTSGFCYGEKQVDSIIRWTEPGTSSRTEVTYTYRIVNLAVWAKRPDIQEAFPGIRATLNDASKIDQIAGLQLTGRGWQVT